MKKSVPSPWVAWWDLPEERRYWIPEEMQLIIKYASLTRSIDPQKRPNYMYIPGDYDQEAVEQYVDYLDIIPAAIYTTNYGQPHAWARWRMESTVDAINAKAEVGPDYLAGQKTPVGVLELYYEDEIPDHSIMTPEGAYHDFWEAIVSGAKGIMVYSYYHRNDKPELDASWQALASAASQIDGPEQLGQVILQGTPLSEVDFTITRGPTLTEEFSVPLPEDTQRVRYPSIHLLAESLNGDTYVFAVNSAEKPVSATIKGLGTATHATVLFEDSTLPISDGNLKLDFPPLGVHIFKIQLDKSAPNAASR